MESKVLYDASQESGPDALPRAGREKTLRSISRVADVIVNDRWNVAVRVTGMYKKDEATKEAIRALVIVKAKEYVVLKLPVGVALERTAPKLRDAAQYSDEEVVAWLTGPGLIAQEVMPTTVKGSTTASTSGTSGDGSVAPADIDVSGQRLHVAGHGVDVRR